jgi:hypothetical protein
LIALDPSRQASQKSRRELPVLLNSGEQLRSLEDGDLDRRKSLGNLISTTTGTEQTVLAEEISGLQVFSTPIPAC